MTTDRDNPMPPNTRRCLGCRRTLPLSAFDERLGMNANPQDRHYRTCTTCRSGRSLATRSTRHDPPLGADFWRLDPPDQRQPSVDERKRRLFARAAARGGDAR